MRLLVCALPVKSPWLNPIEPKWLHGKKRIVEPARLLPAHEVADRVCAAFACPHEPHLVAPAPAPSKRKKTPVTAASPSLAPIIHLRQSKKAA